MKPAVRYSIPQDVLTRRGLIALGARGAALLSVGTLLGGCANQRRVAALPNVDWPDDPIRREPVEIPAPPGPPTSQAPSLPTGVIPRSDWARSPVVPALMDRALPYYRITIHHDGIDPFTSTDRGAAAERLELIRKSHRTRNFGDIGYHYLIDPAGRVWQGRPLQWQGAHVKATNEGNLGICMLGNFQMQRPSPTQVAALDRFVASQMQRYNVPVARVFTHRELAPTVCPGNNLQGYMARTRSTSGALATA